MYAEWTCVFPGKMGLSWKLAWNHIDTEENARDWAAHFSNAVAVPLELYRHMKEMEHRVVAAEGKLQEMGVRMDYIDGQPVFVDLNLSGLR